MLTIPIVQEALKKKNIAQEVASKSKRQHNTLQWFINGTTDNLNKTVTNYSIAQEKLMTDTENKMKGKTWGQVNILRSAEQKRGSVKSKSGRFKFRSKIRYPWSKSKICSIICTRMRKSNQTTENVMYWFDRLRFVWGLKSGNNKYNCDNKLVIIINTVADITATVSFYYNFLNVHN